MNCAWLWVKSRENLFFWWAKWGINKYPCTGKMAGSFSKRRTEACGKWDSRGWEPQEGKMETSNPEGTTPGEPKKHKGTRYKNPKFKMPKSAPKPMKALWDSATEEEKQKAHQAAVSILETWMGQASREEVAKKLGVPSLRVWQMSRQALVGLVAGLLKQPKVRKGKNQPALPPEEDPVKLRKKIATLEKDLGMMKELVGLLREFPAHREGNPTTEADGKTGKKKKQEVPKGTDKKDGPVAQGGGSKIPSASSGPTAGGK